MEICKPFDFLARHAELELFKRLDSFLSSHSVWGARTVEKMLGSQNPSIIRHRKTAASKSVQQIAHYEKRPRSGD